MTEFEQLALDTLVAPGPVLPRQPLDQRGDRVVEGWATGAVRVGPPLGHQAVMPPQEGGRGDQAVTAQHRGQVSDQRGEQGAVGPVQPSLGLALRSTATSWRRTRSSMSLDDGARGSSVSQFSSWLKIR